MLWQQNEVDISLALLYWWDTGTQKNSLVCPVSYQLPQKMTCVPVSGRGCYCHYYCCDPWDYGSLFFSQKHSAAWRHYIMIHNRKTWRAVRERQATLSLVSLSVVSRPWATSPHHHSEVASLSCSVTGQTRYPSPRSNQKSMAVGFRHNMLV